MDYKIIAALIAALTGLVSGIIASLFAPWVQWRIEEIRLKHKRHLDLIDQWRIFIENFDFENQSFGDTTVYGAMKLHMDKETINKFENPFEFHVANKKRGKLQSKQWASDEVAKIERKWNLI